MNMGARARATASVEDYLQGCAQRGFFNRFSRLDDKKGLAHFSIGWHHDTVFEVFVDSSKQALRMPVVLPGVEKASDLDRDFRAFVKRCHSESIPAHRRIDRARVEIKPILRAGNMSLSTKVKNGDYDYAIDKLICLVHEVFKLFLKDGLYYQYMIDRFGLNPDTDF
ncbi:MAG: hypothetical protein HOC23_14470 [Halieaceae bacterium]|jgi:hypothetical protein|nr:hypothetical protein [Halieaceae bacterium]